MAPHSHQGKKDAVRALINIAALEGFVLIAVIGVYLATDSIVFLIGGVIASSLIFLPMLLRWRRAHGRALAVKSGAADPAMASKTDGEAR